MLRSGMVSIKPHFLSGTALAMLAKFENLTLHLLRNVVIRRSNISPVRHLSVSVAASPTVDVATIVASLARRIATKARTFVAYVIRRTTFETSQTHGIICGGRFF